MPPRIPSRIKEPPVRRHALALFAGLLLAHAAGPAGAQSALTLRDRLVVVSSASSAGITQLLAGGFTQRHQGVVPPITDALGSTRALELFCTGVGPQTPDLAVVTRRMTRAVQEACNANGVRDIIELQIGLGAVVLVTRRGEALPGLTTRQVWEALAAERPAEEDFAANGARLWSDIGAGLPRSEIRAILPEHGSGTRALFDDLVLEAGCRHVRAIRLIFEAAYRRRKCVTLRGDARITDVASDRVTAALLAAPPGTVAAVSYDQLVASGGNLVAIPLDGVVPSPRSIGAIDYEPARTFFVYAKRQHSRNQQGVGVVRGIREFMIEATSEHAGGPGGYLSEAGLVPLPPADRAAQRRVAERQSLMSR
jgi:phosphate transport system substrate-binding protein